jgi:hypothetical protein
MEALAMTEQQPYSVVSAHGSFEVRRYPEHMLVQVDVRGGVASGAGAGFGPLFQYISGANAGSQSIAMTAPVLQQQTAPSVQTVSFVLPADMDAERAPAPRNPRVRTTAVGERLVAARRFSGNTRAERFTDEGAALVEWVRRAGLTPVGDVFYARFDPPWKPGFLRHNEALVEISATDSK